MATQLSKATKDVKKYLLIFGVFVVLVFIINMIVTSIKDPLRPTTTSTVGYPKADNLFQQIPKPQLQSLPIDPGSKALIAKTSAQFAAEPPVIYMYKIKPEREYLQDADNARNTAKVLNFNPIETTVINNVMYWETPEKNRYLQYDKVQRMWSYRYANYPVSSATALLTDVNIYRTLGLAFLRALNMETGQFDSNAGKAELVNIDANGQINNNSNSPNAVKIALYKKIELIEPTANNIDTPYANVRKYNYYDGIANVIVNGDASNIKTDLLQLNYKNYTYTDDKGIYTILTPENAFAKIQAKQAFLYRINLSNQNNYTESPVLNVDTFKIDPTLTQLIYIEPENRSDDQAWTNYLQPFYLFEGNFVTSDQQQGYCSFLVPALQDSLYK